MTVRDDVSMFRCRRANGQDACGGPCRECRKRVDDEVEAYLGAGYLVVSSGVIHKALQDAFQSGAMCSSINEEIIKQKHKYCDIEVKKIKDSVNASSSNAD